jgi:hypothetical protein
MFGFPTEGGQFTVPLTKISLVSGGCPATYVWPVFETLELHEFYQWMT